MEILTISLAYLVVAITVSLTGYFVIYRPSMAIVHEVLERKPVGGIFGFLIWTTITTVLAPWLTFLLLTNDNESVIRSFSLGMIERNLEEEDE